MSPREPLWKELFELARKAYAAAAPFLGLPNLEPGIGLAVHLRGRLDQLRRVRGGQDIVLDALGLRGAPPEFRHGVRRFLAFYLGSAQVPVPFGGRQRELDALRAWAEDPAAPSRGLLTAPAGRGKSALVARFVAGMAERKDWRVIFLPVSIRFETNTAGAFWRAFAEALAEVGDEELPAEMSVDALRSEVRAGLERLASREGGSRILLVVDGLDEAAGWELPEGLAARSSPRLRFLVSARDLPGHERADSWPGRLGWSGSCRRWTLDPLDEAGIADLLDRTGREIGRIAEHLRRENDPREVALALLAFVERETRDTGLKTEPLRQELARLRADLEGLRRETARYEEVSREVGRWLERLGALGAETVRLGRDPTVVAELARLTGGEPLLLAWYVELLLDHRFAGPVDVPALLERAEPGYRGIFARWLQQEEERAKRAGARLDAGEIEDLLALFALAEGPLALTDLRDLLRQMRNDPGLALSPAGLRPLRRFVMGGTEEGYALQHPKIGEYLREERFAETGRLERAADAFRGWLAATLDALEAGTLPPAGVPRYLLRHGVVHAAGAPHLWKQLTAEAWRRAHLEAGEGEPAFARDVGQIFEFAVGRAPDRALALRLRCALVLSSVRARGRNIPDELLVAAAEEGLIGAEEAELVAREREDLLKRAGSFLALAGVSRFAEDVRRAFLGRALAAARGIRDKGWRAWVLAALAPQLPETDRQAVLGEALEAARGIGDEEARARVLAALAPQLPEPDRQAVLGEALEAARGIGFEEARARVLAALAPHLPQQVLEAARGIGDEWWRARVLAALAPQLPQQVLEAARGIGFEEARARVLVALAPQLPGAQRQAVLGEALEAARGIGDEEARARVLVALAPQLPGAQRQAVLGEALEAARGIRDEGWRARVLAALAPQLPEPERQAVLDEALEAARRIWYKGGRAEVLAALAPQLPEPERQAVLGEALEAARGILDEGWRARVLAALAPHLPQQVLEAARGIGNEWERARVLAALAPHLPQQVLEAARGIGDEWWRARVLAALAPHLPQQVLEAARGIGDEWWRARVLAALAPQLPQQVLEAARGIGFEEARARVLVALAPQLPGAQRQAVLGEALEAARGIGDEEARARVLVALAPQLPGAQRQAVLGEALEAARGIGDERQRAEILAALAPQLPEPERQAVLGEALEAARGIGFEEARARVLVALAPQLPEPERQAVLDEALEAARRIWYKRERAEVLAALAPQLPQQVLEAAGGITSEWERARVLAALAPQLPQEVLEAAYRVRDKSERAQVLAALAAQQASPEVSRQALAELIGLGARAVPRPRFLDALATALPGILAIGGESVMRELFEALEDVTRWYP